MERKTNVIAEEGRQDLIIQREFELSVGLLFKAYVEPDIVEQWMGTRVIKLDPRPHGSWIIETSDPQGNVMFRANGVIHNAITDKLITRTFEMEGAPFGVQLEFLSFESLSEDKSKLTMHVIYESNGHRDEMLKLPFAYGINMAHDRLQQILGKIN